MTHSDTVAGRGLRVRLHPAHHPYGQMVWAYEVYDPADRPGMQVLIGGGWYASWDAARRRGLARLAEHLAQADHAGDADGPPAGPHQRGGVLGQEPAMTAAGGDCVMTRLGSEPPYGLRIDRADPVIYIHAEVLKELRGGNSPYASLVDDILRIEGVNRTVIYRLGKYDPLRNAYLAERVEDATCQGGSTHE